VGPEKFRYSSIHHQDHTTYLSTLSLSPSHLGRLGNFIPANHMALGTRKHMDINAYGELCSAYFAMHQLSLDSEDLFTNIMLDNWSPAPLN
jgi:hypothetical protein